MLYRDEQYAPELGDKIEVYDDRFEPEEATVLKIGKRNGKLLVEWSNPNITPAKEWVRSSDCDMISRAG